MDIEILVSTMDLGDYKTFSEKMNIQTKVLIVDQCNKYEYTEDMFNNNKIKIMSLKERGIGLSRNTALMRCESDICIFADDDVRYIDGYSSVVLEEFKNNPNADVILFNVPSTNKERPTAIIKKYGRIRWFNSLKFGAVNIAARTKSLRKANVMFSLLFGGGAKYSAGEDSIFIMECLRKKIKIYTSPVTIGYVSQEDSSWFEGYTYKYFYDKGIWLANAFPRLKYFLAVYYSIKSNKNTDISFSNILKYILKGIGDYKEL